MADYPLIKYNCMKKLLVASLFFYSFQQGFSQSVSKPEMQVMYNAIKAAGIEHPDFVMAQCMQETGNLRCKKCCLRYHNLFGFYINGHKCKKFSSDSACINYYKRWQDKSYDKWRKKYPREDYYHFLKYAKYATGDKYTNELKPKVDWVRKHLNL